MAINLFGRGAVWSGEGDEIDDDAEQLDIPIHAFDVVIADECHRGYTTAEESALAKHARPLRRRQDRPDGDPRGAHQGLLQRRRLPVRVRRAPSARATSSTTTSSPIKSERADAGRLPEGRRAGRARRPRDAASSSWTSSRTSGTFDADRGRAERHLARLEPEDPRRGPRSTPSSTRSGTAASRRRSSSPPTTCRTPPTPTSSSSLRSTSSAAARTSSGRSPAGSTGRSSGSASSATARTRASSSRSICSRPASTSPTSSSSSSCAR